MKKLIVLFSVVFIIFQLVGCGGLPTSADNENGGENGSGDSDSDSDNDDDNSPSSQTISKLNITDATVLFIAPALASASLTALEIKNLDAGQRLFKITADGYILEVTATNEEGEEVTITETPVAVYNVDSNYVIVCFGGSEISVTDGYLVRKSDGTVYSLESAGIPVSLIGNGFTYFKNEKIVQVDSTGNIYYAAKDSVANIFFEVVKLNMSDPDNPTGEIYSSSTDDIDAFVVDAVGNVAYKGTNRDNTSLSVNRVRTVVGSFANMPNGTYTSWRGYDDSLYFEVSGDVRKVSVEGGAVSFLDYGASSDIGGLCCNPYYFEFESRIVITGYRGIYEANNPSETPREVTGLPITTIATAANSPNYYYMAGNDSGGDSMLIRVNPETDEYENMYDPGLYDVYSFTVSDSDEITFNAMRMSDGAKIIGNIAADKTLTVLDESLDTEITSLVRVN